MLVRRCCPSRMRRYDFESSGTPSPRIFGRCRRLPDQERSSWVAPVKAIEEAPDVRAAPHVPALELGQDQGTVLDVLDELRDRRFSGHRCSSLLDDVDRLPVPEPGPGPVDEAHANSASLGRATGLVGEMPPEVCISRTGPAVFCGSSSGVSVVRERTRCAEAPLGSPLRLRGSRVAHHLGVMTETTVPALPHLSPPGEDDRELRALIDSWRYAGAPVSWDDIVGHGAPSAQMPRAGRADAPVGGRPRATRACGSGAAWSSADRPDRGRPSSRAHWPPRPAATSSFRRLQN